MAKFDGIDGEFMDLGRLGSQAAWIPYPGAQGLVRKVHELHPKGVDQILIGLHKLPGYQFKTDSKGIIAILIGLLLPAVQKCREAASSDRQLLAGALTPTGQIGFLMADGSVRPYSQSGRNSKWIEIQNW